MFRAEGTSDLPDELILQFFLYLTPGDLAIASLVCHSFARFANFSELWQSKLKHFEHVVAWAASQENIDYKLLTKKVLHHPNLYADLSPADLYCVDKWDMRQQDAAEKLYLYAKQIRTGAIARNGFFYAQQDNYYADLSRAVNILKQIILGGKTREDLHGLHHVLETDLLARIYNELINVNLLTDTLAEMLTSLQTPINVPGLGFHRE